MIITGDLASAELRIVAWLAQEKGLLDAFARGENFHLKNARIAFGPGVQKGDDEYTLIKSAIYRFVYSVPGRIPSDLGQLRATKAAITPEMIAMLYKTLERTYPAIVVWKKQVISELHTTHKVKNIFGRYRDLSWGMYTWAKDLIDHCEQAALNWQVQTVVGKVINRAFIKWDTWFDEQRACGMQGYPCLQCHDELGAWTPDEHEVPVIAASLKAAIEAPIPEMNNLIIPSEICVGPSWGKKELYAFA